MNFPHEICVIRSAVGTLLIGPRRFFANRTSYALGSEEEVRRCIRQVLIGSGTACMLRIYWNQWRLSGDDLPSLTDAELIDRLAVETRRGTIAVHILPSATLGSGKRSDAIVRADCSTSNSSLGLEQVGLLENVLSPEQLEFLNQLLSDLDERGFSAPDMAELVSALKSADEDGRWRILQSIQKGVDARVAQAGETRFWEFLPDALGEGQDRVEIAQMVTNEGAERVGAIEGRKYAESVLRLRDANWVNPFEGRRSRFGQGFDDVMIDAQGNYWIVEYKGGTSGLERDQMERSWVRRKIVQYRKQGGPLGEFWAQKIEAALNSGRLRGVALKTEILGRTPQSTVEIKRWIY